MVFVTVVVTIISLATLFVSKGVCVMLDPPTNPSSCDYDRTYITLLDYISGGHKSNIQKDSGQSKQSTLPQYTQLHLQDHTQHQL